MIRFWSKVNKNGRVIYPEIGQCWEWTAGTFNHGYGGFLFKTGKPMLAHRVSWLLTHGTLPPKGKLLLHRCDNKLCVNPNHLRIGTAFENAQDMVQRKRVANGERASRRKLTERQVRAILKSKASWPSLARKYGVYYSCIWKIKHGQLWAHLQESA